MTNFRSLATAMLLGVSALAAVGPANAAPACRDAHGKFVKCTAGMTAPKTATAAKPAKTPRTAALSARTAAKPVHAMAAAKTTVPAAHKTSTAAHPAG